MNKKAVTTETTQIESDSETIQNQISRDFPPTAAQTLVLELTVRQDLQWRDGKFQCGTALVELRCPSGQKLQIAQRKIAAQVP